MPFPLAGLFGSLFGRRQAAELTQDAVWADTFAAPYRGPLDLDQYGTETAEMRYAYRELVRREGTVKSAIDGKAGAVACLDVAVLPADKYEPGDQDAADFVRDCVEGSLQGWDGLIYDVVRPALIDGFAIGEPLLAPIESGRWAGRGGLQHVRSLDTIHLRLQTDPFRRVTAVVNLRVGMQAFPPDRFVIFTHNSLFSNPFGASDLRAAHRAANLIADAWKVWQIAVRNFSLPFIHGKYSSAERKRSMEKALELARAGNFIATPKEDDVQIINLASATGTTAFKEMVQALREDIYLAVRGAYLPYMQGSGGGEGDHGNTGVSKSAGSDPVEFLLAKAIGRCLTKCLGRWLVAPNFPAGTGWPKISLGGVNWAETNQQIDAAAKLQNLGLALSKTYLYEVTSIPPPAEADPDDTLPGKADPPGGGPPGMGGPFNGGGLPPPPNGPDPGGAMFSAGVEPLEDGHFPGDLHERAGMGSQEFADRSHLVRKQIRDKNGVTSWRWVNPNKGGGGATTGADQPKAPEPKTATRDRVTEAETAVAAAVGDPARLHAGHLEQLADHLDHLTRDRLRELARQMEQKVGGKKAELADRLLAAIQAKREAANTPTEQANGPGDGRGSERDAPEAPEPRGPVAAEAGGPGDGGTGEGRPGGSEPARPGPAQSVPAPVERVNQRIDRFAKHFRDKGQHEVAGWLDKLKAHVAAVGVGAALESLGADRGRGDGSPVQYEGGWATDRVDEFVEPYLARTGITMVNTFDLGSDANKDIVSSLSPSQGATEDRGRAGDYLPADPTLANKLEEAKRLPGLESSEDINVIVGRPVTALTEDVTAKLDERYGKGQWIVKAYGDDAAAGYGIFFPQRAEQIKRDAQATLWAAGENLAKYGFSLDRDESGTVVGIVHAGGDKYPFGEVKRWEEEDADGRKTVRFDHVGSEEYDSTIDGDVRHWGDKAAAAAADERGASLPGGGLEFMAQPAFAVAGVSDADRAAGMTIKPGQEGRVHVVTRNGKAELVPHSTWLKKEPLPVVFESDDTRAMAQAAVDAINALPESERAGQIYAPDVVRTATGYKVVEANPANHTGSSGYLGDSPFVIDAYVSHLTGRTPAHVQFVRDLLAERQKGDGRGRGGRTPRAEGGDPLPPRTGAHVPEDLADGLRAGGVKPLPEATGDGGRWDHGAAVQKRHNAAVLAAAKRGGYFLPPEAAGAMAKGPNVGGSEHDVHEDAENNRFVKFTKGGHFGQNKDALEYLERHKVANELWPELGHRFHGVTQDAAGNPQLVSSVNRIDGPKPSQTEVHEWFERNGWEPEGEVTDPDEIWEWRDPKTGTVVRDAQDHNFVKTPKGLVPIDVDILPGEGSHRAAPK
jgi:hypothetical protein